MSRYIKMPLGCVNLGAYVRAWRVLLAAAPGSQFNNHGFSPCGSESETRERLLAEFRKGMHDRINKHAPGYGKGRCWNDLYQIETARIARKVNTPRLLVMDNEVPAWLRGRFGSRVHSRDDL